MQEKGQTRRYCGSYDTTGELNLELLNENLRNVSGLTYKGSTLSDENRIEELPTDVNVNGFDFKISNTGEVEDEVISPGTNSGGNYGSGMTRDELEQYLLEVTKNIKEKTKEEMQPEIDEKISNAKKEIYPREMSLFHPTKFISEYCIIVPTMIGRKNISFAPYFFANFVRQQANA